MKYTVKSREIISRVFEVEANSSAEAREKASKVYTNDIGEIDDDEQQELTFFVYVSDTGNSEAK
jgi:hypothetical protein